MKHFCSIVVILVMCGVNCFAQTVSGKKGGHDYVDLSLPSGRLWATCNVGTSKSTGYGDFFAWGDTEPRDTSEESGRRYKFRCKYYGNPAYSKYVTNPNYGYPDKRTTLEPVDDAATANWGEEWRMPTFTEMKELVDGCNWQWVIDYKGSGVNGNLGTSKTNGCAIFLPAAGYIMFNGRLSHTNKWGKYWSSSLYDSNNAYCISVYQYGPNYQEWTKDLKSGRDGGQFTVRAVVK